MKKQAPFYLTTLTIILGGQLLRVLFPSIGWYLRDTVKISVTGLIPYALGPFLLGFVVLLLLKWLKPSQALLIAGIGLLAARLIEQISREPGIDLWAAMAGAMFFLWMLPLLLSLGRMSFVYGVLLGLSADTALKGITYTLDLSWIGGWQALLFIGLLLLLFAYALWLVVTGNWVANGRSWRPSLALVGFGLWLLLQWLIFNNQGWVTTLTGWSTELALLLILLGNLGALWAATLVQRLSSKWLMLLWLLVYVGAVVALLLAPDWFALFFLIASVSNGFVLPLLVGYNEPRAKLIPPAFMLLLGMLLFLIDALLYYISLELPLPFGQQEILVFIALFIGLCGLLAIVFLPETAVRPTKRLTYALPLGAALLLVPVSLFIIDLVQPAPTPPDSDYPIRVMTYNLHSGFGTSGRQMIAEAADVIEASGADVVGFQEISRGMLLDSSVDLVNWLSRRLDMPYVAFISTIEDPLWGNAVLSRYPITQIDTGLLPTMGTLIRRGYVGATIDVDGQEPLLFISTHLQHKADDLNAVHMAQLEVILDYWDERPYTVLVGDMNARPGWPQMEMVQDAGFVDSWAEAGEGPGYTSNAANPEYRIDWIFHTPDTTALEAEFIESQASDHFPVVVTLDR